MESAVLENLKLSCWGANYDGQVGDGTTIAKVKPTSIGILGYEIYDFSGASFDYFSSFPLSLSEIKFGSLIKMHLDLPFQILMILLATVLISTQSKKMHTQTRILSLLVQMEKSMPV